MNKTDNYELNKPELTDIYNVGDFNDNMDIIDEELKDLSDNKLNGNGNGKNVTVSYTSSDTDDGAASSWITVAKLVSGETLRSIMEKVSSMFANIRYLYSIRPDALSSSSNTPADNDIVISKENGGTAWVKKTMSKLWAYIDSKIAGHNYLVCSTGRNTANKVVAYTGFELRTGSRIAVRFTNTGTSNPSSGNLTLNVNSTGAKTIVNGRTNKTVMTYANADYFYNNKVAEFVYDGTYWVYLSNVEPVYDTALSNTSTNAVQNKKVQSAIAQALAKLAETDLSNVTTASRPHTAGKYLIYGSVATPKFGQVLTDIAVNETWNSQAGGNITDIRVSDELSTLKDALNTIGEITYLGLIDATHKTLSFDKSIYKYIYLTFAITITGNTSFRARHMIPVSLWVDGWESESFYNGGDLHAFVRVLLSNTGINDAAVDNITSQVAIWSVRVDGIK